MRGATNQIEGEFTAWDPADPRPFIAAAGTRFIRAEGDRAVVWNENGTEADVYPGWLAFRPDGSGPDGAIFTPAKNVSAGTATIYRVEQAG